MALRALAAAQSSWRPSGTAIRRRPSHGALPSTLPRCPTSSASAPSGATDRCPATRTVTRCSTTSPRRGRTSSRPSRAASRVSAPACQEQGYSLCATSGVPTRRRDVVRGSAGQRSCRDVALGAARVAARAGDRAARAHRGRRERPERLPPLRPRQGRVHGLGHARHHGRARRARAFSCPRPTRSRRTTTRATGSHRLSGTWRRAAGRRDGGLLGRSGRRLRRVPAQADRRLDASLDGDGGDLSLALWRAGDASRCSVLEGQ